MARTYIVSGSTSDLTLGTEFNYVLQNLDTLQPGTTSNEVVSLGASATSTGSAFTKPGEPGINGATGTITLNVYSTVTNVKVTANPQIHRVNSSGVKQASLNSDGGIQTMNQTTTTWTFTNANLGTWAVGDRFQIEFHFENTDTMKTQAFTFSLGNSVEPTTAVTQFYVPATDIRLLESSQIINIFL